MRNSIIMVIIMIEVEIMIYCQDTALVDKICTYQATKAGVHTIDN